MSIDYPVSGVTDSGTGSYDSPGSGNMAVWTPSRIDDGAWHHVAGVRTQTSLDLYLDGQRVATVVQAPRNPDNTAALYIGVEGINASGQVANGWAGLIDELAIYNRALSPTEISAIHAAGRRRSFRSARRCTLPPPASRPRNPLPARRPRDSRTCP